MVHVIDEALAEPAGAVWHRVALQVNPFGYKGSFEPRRSFDSEASYNTAITDECLRLGIRVIGVTDHWRVDTAAGLLAQARSRGIVALPGFEAVSSEGVHVLMILPEEVDVSVVNAMIGACGASPGCPSGETGNPLEELLQIAAGQNALALPAHVTGDKGLFTVLSGQPLIKAWRSANLAAVAAQPDQPATALHQRILDNEESAYRREHKVGVLWAGDVMHPDGLQREGATCWVKMSAPTLEGIRTAIRTPDTRIGRTDPAASPHAVIRAIAWEGGFLDGVRLRLNESMTCLIGGRGAGKSTVVESIRYVLGLRPIGESARRDSMNMISNVLELGTKVSVLVGTVSPTGQDFLIERTVPDLPVVRGQDGSVLASTPVDVLGSIDIFGQHELAELADSGDHLAELLRRFVGESADSTDGSVVRDLRRNRQAIISLRSQIDEAEDALSELPRHKEALQRFTDAEMDQRLSDQATLQREEGVLDSAVARVDELMEALAPVREQAQIDVAFVSPVALEPLPRSSILAEVAAVLQELRATTEAALSDIDRAAERARAGIAGIRRRWEGEVDDVKGSWDRVLRELQGGGLDAGLYLATQRAVAQLEPVERQLGQRRKRLDALYDERRELLVERQGRHAATIRRLGKACQQANATLKGVVLVKPKASRSRQHILDLIDAEISGQRNRIRGLVEQDAFSPGGLANAARRGVDALGEIGLFGAQAASVAGAGEGFFLQLEEMVVPHAAEASLNLAESGTADWRVLSGLSKGQRATALLLLLLAASSAPLVIDQPEDDLDNRFIAEGVVPRLRELKGRRQLIFSTHNANIPVLGDSELLAVLEADANRGRVAEGGVGSLDAPVVKARSEQILEGGKDAFTRRQYMYGF